MFKNGIKIVTLLTVRCCEITTLQLCKVLIFRKLQTSADISACCFKTFLDSRS